MPGAATNVKMSLAQRMMGGPRLVRVVKRVVLIIALLYGAVGIWSVYRAWAQVQVLDVKLMSTSLRPGMPSVVRVVTSGLTYVTVRFDLVQGSHSETLADLRVAPSPKGIFSPGKRQGSMMPSFTAEFLAKFQPGPAIVRTTATGVPKWYLSPAPLVQEVPVVVMGPGM